MSPIPYGPTIRDKILFLIIVETRLKRVGKESLEIDLINSRILNLLKQNFQET